MEYQILIIGLCVIAWKDAMLKQIPNHMLLILVLVRSVLLFDDMTTAIASFVGFLIGGGVMLFGYLLSKGTMGAGDVKLMAVVGSYAGSDMILQVILWSTLAAAAYSLGLLSKNKTETCKEIPFAPFVLLGTIFCFLLENRGVVC